MTTNNSANIQNVSSGSSIVCQKISAQTASSSSNIVFTGLTSAYSMYTMVLNNVQPGTDAAVLYMYFSQDGGSTYVSTYITSGVIAANNNTSNAPAQFQNGSNQSQVYLTSAIGVGGGADGTINIIGAADASRGLRINFNTALVGPAATYYHTNINATGAGGSASVNAIKFAMSTGTILSGIFTLYGLLA